MESLETGFGICLALLVRYCSYIGCGFEDTIHNLGREKRSGCMSCWKLSEQSSLLRALLHPEESRFLLSWNS